MRLVNNKCRKVKCQQKVSSERLKSPHTGICQSHRAKCHKLRKTLHKIITHRLSIKIITMKEEYPPNLLLQRTASPTLHYSLTGCRPQVEASNPILQVGVQPQTQSSNLNLNPILQPPQSASTSSASASSNLLHHHHH